MLILFAFILENAYLFAHGNANLFDYAFQSNAYRNAHKFAHKLFT